MVRWDIFANKPISRLHLFLLSRLPFFLPQLRSPLPSAPQRKQAARHRRRRGPRRARPPPSRPVLPRREASPLPRPLRWRGVEGTDSWRSARLCLDCVLLSPVSQRPCLAHTVFHGFPCFVCQVARWFCCFPTKSKSLSLSVSIPLAFVRFLHGHW
jgi:hypothetical protein